jgi:hypothetical protein
MKSKTVTVEVTQKELEMLNKLREEQKRIVDEDSLEAKLNALAMKYENASMAKIKKDYINEFGTDPITDFVKDAYYGEIGERFVECISKELLVELFMQHVSQKDINAWFNNTIDDGRFFMVERLIDKKIGNGEHK